MIKKDAPSLTKYSGINYQMCILSAIAVCFVVIGHIHFGYVDMTEAGTFYGWFPYYSFHLPIFLFITGYFFRDPVSFSRPAAGNAGSSMQTAAAFAGGASLRSHFRSFGRFILHKARTLLLPYYVITGIFLLFNILLRSWDFTWPQTCSLTTWLVDPWTKLYTLTLGVPAWYLISLFVAEIYFVLLRTLLQKLIRRPLAMEITCLLLCLALGVTALAVNDLPGCTQTAQVYLRPVLMLFFIQAGVLYRRYLEKRDTLGSLPYFLIIFAVQFLIILLSGNSMLSPGLYGLIGFESFGYDYFLAGLTGVALYLRISRLLSLIPGKSRFVLFFGTNTLYVMSFHILGFFLLNALLDQIRRIPAISVFMEYFDNGLWHRYLYYTFTHDPRMIFLYLLAGVGISLLIALIVRTCKKAMKRTLRRSGS